MLKIASEKSAAKIAMLERNKIVYFHCFPRGFREKILAQDNFQKDVKKALTQDGPYEDKKNIAKWLGMKECEENRLQEIRPIEGDDFPSLVKVSGIIISGSPFSVNDNEVWMRKLEEYIRVAASKNIAILGICFGHQLIAKAFGAAIKKTQQSEIGTVQINLTVAGVRDRLLRDLPIKNLNVLTFHENIIGGAPYIIRSLGFNAHDANQVIAVGDNVRGVQFHPETRSEMIKTLIYLSIDNLAKEGIDTQKILKNIKYTPKARKILSNFYKYFILSRAHK